MFIQDIHVYRAYLVCRIWWKITLHFLSLDLSVNEIKIKIHWHSLQRKRLFFSIDLHYITLDYIVLYN